MNRYEQQGDPTRIWETQSPTDKTSVGGWLLIFCIINGFGLLKSVTTILETRAPLFLALYITLSILTILALITIFAKASSALTCVSFCLGARFLYGLLQIYLATRMSKVTTGGAMSSADTEFASAIGNVIGSIIWYFYFHLSTRVRQTLGRKL